MLHTGDLAVGRSAPSYGVGDVVTFKVTDDRHTGYVIHRLVAGSAEGGWRTKGDNNDAVDPWTVADRQIAGRYWFSVAGAGRWMAWATTHQFQFGALCAALVVATYLPRRPRRLSPTLLAALAAAEREPRRQGRPGAEYLVLGISGSALLAGVGLVGVLGTSHRLQSASGLVAVLALGWAGAATWYLVSRLFDGTGLPEPARSQYALSGRVWRVGEFPQLDMPVRQVASPVELRELAEKYRLPVLHRVDGVTGRHEYLLVTVQKGAFIWSPAKPAQHRLTGSGHGPRSPGGPTSVVSRVPVWSRW